MSRNLLLEWNLDPVWTHYFNLREGEICISCGASGRARQMALSLLLWMSDRLKVSEGNLSSAVTNPVVRALDVAEINACASVHNWLLGLPKLRYSEFQSDKQNVPHEDLSRLSYADESFDLVLHSDTLEHVPDVDRALSEIWRVLRKGGTTIFSIPLVRDGRRSLVRARSSEAGVEFLLPPSYHGGSYQATRQYLVFHEFGEDFISRLQTLQFETTLVECPTNPSSVTFICKKPIQTV